MTSPSSTALSARKGQSQARKSKLSCLWIRLYYAGLAVCVLVCVRILLGQHNSKSYLDALMPVSNNSDSSSTFLRHSMEKTDNLTVDTARDDVVVKKTPTTTTTTTTTTIKPMVSCGAHQAPSCEECTQGHGEAWCHGACQWCPSKKQCLPEAALCPIERIWLPPEPEPWFTPPAQNYSTTLSVILPCGSEHEYFDRTIKSVHAATPASILKEIVVVDDNSKPPLEPLFPQATTEYKVKYVRSDVSLGLIDAKHQGAVAASGDIIVFLDCHVKPALGWWEPLVREIGSHPKRVVVPTITSLNADTWVETGRPAEKSGGLSKCYLTLDGEFKWTNDDTQWVPIMSGGLLAMSRDWFFEVGGHDQSMKGWGGENLDLSLRIWLCGGEIVAAPKSYVAHMWRDAKHKAKYTIPPNSAGMNRARAMKAHLPKFFEKTLTFPDFVKWRKSGGKELEVDSIKEPMKKLHCHDIEWFFDFFSYIYRDGGLIPKQVFQLTFDGGTTCLQLASNRPWGNAKQGQDTLLLKPCTDVLGPNATDTGTQFWHVSNRNAEGKCCSGLKVWNTDQCIVRDLKSAICDLTGSQPAALTVDGLLKVGRSKCLSANPLRETKCNKDATKWEKLRPFQPPEYLLLSSTLKAKW